MGLFLRISSQEQTPPKEKPIYFYVDSVTLILHQKNSLLENNRPAYPMSIDRCKNSKLNLSRIEQSIKGIEYHD